MLCKEVRDYKLYMLKIK